MASHAEHVQPHPLCEACESRCSCGAPVERYFERIGAEVVQLVLKCGRWAPVCVQRPGERTRGRHR